MHQKRYASQTKVLLNVGASGSLLVPVWCFGFGTWNFLPMRLRIASGCSGKPARQNKNRMTVKSCFEEFAARLRDFIVSAANRSGAADQRIFESLALELFALQFEHNLA